jgi:hypothetical protein
MLRASILVGLADGSVRLLSPEAALGAASGVGGAGSNWQAALTLRRGEVLGPDW